MKIPVRLASVIVILVALAAGSVYVLLQHQPAPKPAPTPESVEATTPKFHVTKSVGSMNVRINY